MSRVRVLVVDDVDIFREMMRMLIRRVDGLESVAEAADGAEAIEMARIHQPNLVMLDMNMPGMNGDEALPGIRKAVPNARVVIVSGLDPSEVRERLKDQPVDGIIEKRLSVPELMAALTRYAERDAGVPDA